MLLLEVDVPKAKAIGMSVTPYKFVLSPGDQGIGWATVSNPETRSIHVHMFGEGPSAQFVTFEPCEFDLPPGPGLGSGLPRPCVDVQMLVDVPENATEGFYDGSYNCISGGACIGAPLTVRVFLYDFYVSSDDIQFSIASPTEGDEVEINATIHNSGPMNATNVLVQFYDGFPESGGIQIGQNRTLDQLLSGATDSVQVNWFTEGRAGNHSICIIVDPYDIVFEASEQNNEADKQITVYSKSPAANFTWNPYEPRAGETVAFDGSYSTPDGGAIVSYKWSFGDGGIGSGETVTHVYPVAGDYVVSLNVTDDEQLWDLKEQQIQVAPLPLFVSINPLNCQIQLGQSVSFLSTVNGGVTPYAYQWYLNGTLVSGTTLNNWTFTPTTIGTYNVYLNVTDTYNSTAQSETAQITVIGEPSAEFIWEPQIPEVGEAVTFNASASLSGDTSIIDYGWNFGDGNETSTSNPIINHAYSSPDIYSVTLTVRNSGGLTNSTSKLIEVLGHDVAVVSVAPSRNWVYQTLSVNIDVTVENLGNFTETATVKLFYNITADLLVGIQSVTLNPSESKTLTFVWNTAGVQYCNNYTITAVTEIGSDFNTTNNILESSMKVKVRILGDFNGDCYVGVDDLFEAGQCYGTEPGNPRWNVDADLNRDDYVGIDDLFIMASHFGQGCQ